MVTPRGQDVAQALRDWIAADIKATSGRIFELGKFQFGVSSASIGLYITASEATGHPWGKVEWLSLVAFVVSVGVALYIAMPRVHALRASFRIDTALARRVQSVWAATIVWVVSWSLGIIGAGIGFFA